MKKFIFAFALFLLTSLGASAQNYNFNVGGLQYSSGPSVPGSCPQEGGLFFKNAATTGWYQCSGGTYGALAGGGGGITNGAGANVITKSNGTNLIASSLSDDGTNVTSTANILPSGAVNLGSAGARWASVLTTNINMSGTITGAIFGTSASVTAAANGAFWTFGSTSELITLSTSGTTTDSVANLLPANSIITGVTARVTTTITTATNWELGDATTAARFTTANSTLTAGTTDVGTLQVDGAGATGSRQVSAAKLRITTTGTPGAGAIRVTVFYMQFNPPTS